MNTISEESSIFTINKHEQFDKENPSIFTSLLYEYIPNEPISLTMLLKENYISIITDLISELNKSKLQRNKFISNIESFIVNELELSDIRKTYLNVDTLNIILSHELSSDYSYNDGKCYDDILINKIFIIHNIKDDFKKIMLIFTTNELIAKYNKTKVPLKSIVITESYFEDLDLYIEDNPPSKINF